MDRLRFTALFHFALIILLSFASLGDSSIGKKKTQERSGQTKEHYLSKSYGEIQFNKYKGQLPPKGSILSCAIECMTLASCHCLALNIHTAECNFYDMDQSPDYSNWRMDSNTTGMNDVNVTDNVHNYVNSDFIFFTRDILDPNQPSKLDISSGRKWTTSGVLDQYYKPQSLSSTNSISKDKNKEKIKPGKASSNGSKTMKHGRNNKSRDNNNSSQSITEGQFPYPWLQIEFKDSMYLTEVALQTSRGIDDLKHFQIRIGDEPITKFYDDVPSAPDKAVPFQANKLCFEYQNNNKGFFEFGAVRKQNSFVKSIKCRPCGLKGRYLIIQAMSPCTNCQSDDSGSQESKSAKSTKESASSATTIYPFAVSNIEVYGYPIA